MFFISGIQGKEKRLGLCYEEIQKAGDKFVIKSILLSEMLFPCHQDRRVRDIQFSQNFEQTWHLLFTMKASLKE